MDPIERISSAKPGIADLDNPGPAGPGNGNAYGRVRKFGSEGMSEIIERQASERLAVAVETTQSKVGLTDTPIVRSLTSDLSPVLNNLASQFADLHEEISRAPYSPDSDAVPTKSRIG